MLLIILKEEKHLIREVEGDQENMLAAAATTIALFCCHFAAITFQSTAKTNSKDPVIYVFIFLPTPACHGFTT